MRRRTSSMKAGSIAELPDPTHDGTVIVLTVVDEETDQGRIIALEIKIGFGSLVVSLRWLVDLVLFGVRASTEAGVTLICRGKGPGADAAGFEGTTARW